MAIPTPVFLHALGGVAIQLLTVIDGLKAPKDRQPDFKSFSYYLALLLNVSLSVILSLVSFDEKANLAKVVSFHFGA